MTDVAVSKFGLFQSIADAVARLRRRLDNRAELDALGRAETDRMAQDLNLTSSDFRALAMQDEDSAALMERRLAESAIDIHAIDATTLRDMQRCCSQCTSKAICAHELEDKPKAASWPSYCPNEQTIAALAAMKCH
jgi:hypothetical protein